MIILYSKDGCPACSGNTSVSRMRGACSKYGVEFHSRISILWEVWGKEAENIEDVLEIEQPLFYSTVTKKGLKASTFTSTDDIVKFVKEEANFNEKTEV